MSSQPTQPVQQSIDLDSSQSRQRQRRCKIWVPQGITSCWKFWRRCMCTTGWYPVVVAPIVTIGFILSLYSSLGCQFIHIDVGFTPNNLAWNQSTADVGLFYFYHPDDQSTSTETTTTARNTIDDNKYVNMFHEGCTGYNDIFDATFIERDRTWKVARVMAMVAIAGSFLSVVTCWFIVFLPLPVNCLWPAIVLPTIMLAFIAEGSKFLIFDIALCRNAVWFPSGIDSLPAEAENCSLGESAYYGIAAGIVHLIGLLAICLRAPEKRQLDPFFGTSNTTDMNNAILGGGGDGGNNNTHLGGGGGNGTTKKRNRKFKQNQHLTTNTNQHPMIDQESQSVLDDDDVYTTGPSPSSVQLHITRDHHHNNAIDASTGDTSSLGSNEQYVIVSSPLRSSNNLHLHYNNSTSNKYGGSVVSSGNGSITGGHHGHGHGNSSLADESKYSTGSTTVITNNRISESRLSVMSKMQLNQSCSESNEIIDKLVSDLDSSLQEQQQNQNQQQQKGQNQNHTIGRVESESTEEEGGGEEDIVEIESSPSSLYEQHQQQR